MDLNAARDMAEGLKPPPPFSLGSDAAKEWPQWKNHFEYYMKATKKSAEEGPTKVAILLTAMGKDAIAIYKTMTWATPDDADKFDVVLEAFSNYFKPKVNEIYERFTFLQRRQQQGETFDSFYTDLLRLVESCGYHQDERRTIIRDQIVMNITSDAVREKLLAEAALTLEKAADMCRSMEATTHYLHTMSATATSGKECESETALAHAVRRKSGKCQYCAQHHKPRTCPAWGKQCTYCGKMNHLEEACKKAERETAE